MEKTEYICPITLEKIEDFGITVSGSIYEYSAITNWLKNNITDPKTNLPLPTKFVRKISEEEKKMVDTIAKNLRESTLLWNKSFETFTNAVPLWENFVEIQKHIDLIVKEKLEKSTNWEKYCEMKRNFFKNSENLMVFDYSSNFDEKNDTIKRLENTGMGFQFIDLTPTKFSYYKCFKGQLFDFTNLSNMSFYECDFSRCRFIGTNLNGTNFIKCRFQGEQICFYKAQTNGTNFCKCTFEYVEKWENTTDPEEIKKILIGRRMETQKVLISQ